MGSTTAVRYCGRMLATVGARVIALREPGTPAAPLDPYLDAGKYVVDLDVEQDTGRELLLALAGSADVFVAGRTRDELADLGVAIELGAVKASGRILACVTPWGSEGHPTMRKAPELLQFHAGGLGSITPRFANNPDRPPVRMGHPVAEYMSGLSAAVAVLAGLQHRDDTGEGGLIDVSGQQAIAHAESIYMAYASYENRSATRVTRPEIAPFHFLPCADGHIMVICPEQHQWESLVTMMGNPSWADSEIFADARSRALYWDGIEPLLVEWLADKPKAELYRMVQEGHIPLAPVNNVDEVLASAQLNARSSFTTVDAGGTSVRVPGVPFRSTRPLGTTPAAPASGDDATALAQLRERGLFKER